MEYEEGILLHTINQKLDILLEALKKEQTGDKDKKKDK